MAQKSQTISTKITLFLLSGLLLYGGLGINTEVIYQVGIWISTALLIIVLWVNKKIIFPAGFVSYLLFLLFLVVIPTNHLYLFVTGGLLWLVVFNLRNIIQKKFAQLIIFTGTVFGVLYLAYRFIFEFRTEPLSLYLPTSGFFNHNHIGDLWAAILVVAFYYLIKERSQKYVLLTLAGLYFLVMSFSRSAYVALAGGLVYLFWKKEWINKYSKLFWASGFILLALFVAVSTQKTLLFSRPYFSQAIKGFFQHLQGVGVGNFGIISKETGSQLWEIPSDSSMAHNIILEVLSGIGVFSLVFVFWLLKVTINVWKYTKEIVSQLVFVVLGINFLFDYTYFIPTMLWLWFISLGLTQSSSLFKK